MKKIILAITILLTTLNCYAVWPTKEITIVVPYPPGGATDNLARTMQPELEKELKVPVVILNKPGANNAIALNYILNKPNDNHTFLFTIDEFISAPIFSDKTTYEDFKPVSITGTVPFLVFGSSASSLKNFRDEIASGKTVNIASVNVNAGSTIWINSINHKIKFNSIIYKGTTELLTDVAGNQVEYGLMSSTGSASLIQSNKLVPIMVSTKERNQRLPNVPTFHELGFTGSPAETWFGIFTKNDTDETATLIFSKAVRKVVKTEPKFIDFQNKGMTLVNLDIPESVKFINNEIRRFRKEYYNRINKN